MTKDFCGVSCRRRLEYRTLLQIIVWTCEEGKGNHGEPWTEMRRGSTLRSVTSISCFVPTPDQKQICTGYSNASLQIGEVSL